MSNGAGSHMPNGILTEKEIESNDPPSQRRTATSNIKLRMAAIIEDFSCLWFTLSMNTGIMSVLMHQLPYQFNGLGILSTIMFVFNIVLFTIFFTLFLLRMVLYPKAIIKTCMTNLTELCMLGAVPIAWFTLTAQVGITVSTASWGAHAFMLVAYVMWWVGTAVMVTVAVTTIVVMAKTDVTSTEKLSPALVIPFVGTTTDALVGALVIGYSDYVNSRLAIPVIIFGYMLAGVGFFASLMIYSAYFVRLMNHGLPPAAQSPSLVLLVGPCGQSSAALQQLGYAAMKHFGKYGKGTFLTNSAAEIVAAAGTLLGLMFTSMGLFFTAFALYVIIEAAFKRQHKYSLLWWSTIFPMATVNTAFIAFSVEMDSPTFRVLATGLFLILLVDYLINCGFTIRDIYLGKLLNGSRSDRPWNDRAKRQ